MKIIKESINNVPDFDHCCGEIPVVMAAAKEESKRRDEENYKLIRDHRKATGADEKKPFGGERESGFPKNMKNRDELKKMKLSEKLFIESDGGKYSDKLFDLADNMDFSGLRNMCEYFIRWLSEDECEDFWDFYYSDLDEDDEDLTESLVESEDKEEKVGASMRPYLANKVEKGDIKVQKDGDVEIDADIAVNEGLLDDKSQMIPMRELSNTAISGVDSLLGTVSNLKESDIDDEF